MRGLWWVLVYVVSVVGAVPSISPSSFLSSSSPSFSSPPPLFLYGKHFPNGQASVDYIYSDLGMWKNFTPAQYIWNYYNYPNLPSDHPFNISALVSYSTGEHVTTCLDANEHLLLDYNHDGEIDTTDGGFSFHEHNGRGEGDVLLGAPFNNFWFDDNSLCQFMSAAYDMPLPHGLSNYSDFTRWLIVGGESAYWSPYPPSEYFDQLALNGLYYITQNNYSAAAENWNTIISLANTTWNSTSLQYNYPGISASYYLGLIAILTNFLRVMASDPITQSTLLQHSISIRSMILSTQIVNSTTNALCSWCTDIPIAGLQNAETTACNSLGLSAASIHTFEVGSSPLSSDGYFILQPYHVLSAIAGKTPSGYMALGPYWNYPTGNYTAEFILRSSKSANQMATVGISDENTTTVLALLDIDAEMLSSQEWSSFQVPFETNNPSNLLDFQIYYYGNGNLDASVIRIW